MSQDQTRKREGRLSRWAGTLCQVLMGAAMGLWFAGRLFPLAEAGCPFGRYLLAMAWLMLSLVLGGLVQTVVHEAGHLVFGLATGYRFCSFRVGSWMLVKTDGRLGLRRMHLAGTGGQCLLAPPERTDGKMPYRLYNYGGVLLNLAAAALCGLLAWLCRGHWALAVLLEGQVLMALGDAALNGLPLRIGGICNDGYNALLCRRDPAALDSFWIQLRVVEQQSRGLRLKDMPAEWFALPTEEQMTNELTAVRAILAENLAMDKGQLEEAARLCDWLEGPGKALVDLHRSLLLCDRVFCALVLGRTDAALLARWDAKPQRKFRRQMRTFLSVVRTEYAAALLQEQDMAKAARLREEFERCARTYPYKGDLQAEWELLALAQAKTVPMKDRTGENEVCKIPK